MEKGKHNYKSVYTFKLIPNDDSPVKTFKLSKWVVKATAIFTLGIFAVSCFFISSFIYLKVEHAKNTKDLALLRKVNQNQKDQISDLQVYTQDIQNKLDELSVLENEVKDLVGLSDSNGDEKNANDSSSILTNDRPGKEHASRGSFFSRNQKEYQYDQSEELKQIEKTLESIDASLSQGESKLYNLKENVIEQLHYLDAKPDLWPNNGRITSPFGSRRSPTGGASTFHKGIDIANTYGSTIVAAGNGKVIFAGWRSGTGRTIIISHGYGYKTLYAHNSSLLVKEGQKIEKGQPIAKLGSTGISTGPHVHFEIHINGNPVDPLKILK